MGIATYTRPLQVEKLKTGTKMHMPVDTSDDSTGAAGSCACTIRKLRRLIWDRPRSSQVRNIMLLLVIEIWLNVAPVVNVSAPIGCQIRQKCGVSSEEWKRPSQAQSCSYTSIFGIAVVPTSPPTRTVLCSSSSLREPRSLFAGWPHGVIILLDGCWSQNTARRRQQQSQKAVVEVSVRGRLWLCQEEWRRCNACGKQFGDGTVVGVQRFMPLHHQGVSRSKLLVDAFHIHTIVVHAEQRTSAWVCS